MDEWTIPTRSKDVIDKEPFGSDLFERKALASRLTDYLYRLREGCVIGIDAPWGDGKTWFGKNWEADLKKQGFKTVYLDAFQTDYFEDPFLALSGAIFSLLQNSNSQSEKIRKPLLEIGKIFLPMGSRILVSALTRWTLGSGGSEVIEEIKKGIEQETSTITEDFLEARLKDYESEKENLITLRDELSSLVSSDTKPIFFFVDELDRCKPTYAINMLERIKHFFDVSGLIFILMVNRCQLERTVEGIYGLKGEEASEYLQKFVHFFLHLPKRRQLTPPDERDFNRIYGRELAKRFGLATEEDLKAKVGKVIDYFAVFAFLMDFTLRDLEKVWILFSLTLRIGPSNLPIGPVDFYLTYLISLKIKHPDLFSLLLEDDNKEGHMQCMDLIKGLMEKVKSMGVQNPLLETLLILHEAHSEFSNKQPEDHNFVNRWLKIRSYFKSNQLEVPCDDLKLLFPSLLKQLDLSVD
ncbi:hypothetical protein ABH19_11980 [Leptospirillum sp. Group II 'CF-1']|jgi:hypothetical protein|uniref:KAP NTPase domain-containing protein n=1 Tax=Leptospirillum sp. Group II '5-way CG' TaxID=419541 RepID=B6AKT7_9BACT|nr:P-loop NTPase fold protein [Leptospirillum sp. Group II 'CF-1']AKS24315.1 hypothetical protein ABH19_11980 [Leptospirillum sp. Group II 'CF-1']EAY56637.1 MAG: conserved hypothetical protein [Leptospirillum rubarum]EDZ40191.1 MAG: Conserved hypothetical protein [Leptospirillum sp. Group II '5-way CG']